MPSDHRGPAVLIFRHLVQRAIDTRDHGRGGNVYDEIRITFKNLVPIINAAQTDVDYNELILKHPLGLIKYAIYRYYHNQLINGKTPIIAPQITYLVVNSPGNQNEGMAPPFAHYENIPMPLAEQQIIWSAVYAFAWSKDTMDAIEYLINHSDKKVPNGTRMENYPDPAGRARS